MVGIGEIKNLSHQFMQWSLLSTSGANVALRRKKKNCDNSGCYASLDILTFLNTTRLSHYIIHGVTSMNALCHGIKLVAWPNHREHNSRLKRLEWICPFGTSPCSTSTPTTWDQQRWIDPHMQQWKVLVSLLRAMWVVLRNFGVKKNARNRRKMFGSILFMYARNKCT